jgi:spectinomycin phosphotransferase
MTLYPFIEGDTSWTGMTDEQWKKVGASFQRIHYVKLPSAGFESLQKETFDPADYARWIHTFETQHAQAQDEASASQRALRSSWMTHQPTIHTALAILEALGNLLQKRNLPYVICHADLHPANLLRDRRGQVFVIDWDEVMLAPKERDFIFIKSSPSDSETLPGTPAFFQGYGQTEIDWIALTYYRYERVIQDVIAYAQEAFFRDDLAEESRVESAQYFDGILAGNGEIDAASKALAHLPTNLTIPET